MVHYQFATEEQINLADEARKILEKELLPQIHDLELADGGLGKYPMDVHQVLADAGYFGMDIGEEWGGLGMNLVTRGVIAEEMAQVDAGFTFSFFSACGYWEAILATGLSKEEKQEWADRIMAGEAIGSFTFTEAEAGSDALAMRTTAKKEGNEWVINGTKCFASNGPIANYFIVTAWTDKTKKPSEGITTFLVEKERGVTIGKKENKLGIKLSETSEVVFDNVRVPEDHVVGEVGKGISKSLGQINFDGRSLGVTYNVGLAQACLNHAIEYAKTRRQFGKRIIDHQGIGFMIADMEARTQASRALTYSLLEQIDRGDRNVGYKPALTKMFVTDCTMQTALDAVQVLGGYGYMKDYPVEKLLRDAKIFQIFSGTNQIQRKNIMKAIAGRDPLKK